jgi:hypothetical protein
MSVRTEYQILRDEQERVERKLSAQGRAFARWFPAKAPVDHFVWRDPFASAPEIEAWPA